MYVVWRVHMWQEVQNRTLAGTPPQEILNLSRVRTQHYCSGAHLQYETIPR